MMDSKSDKTQQLLSAWMSEGAKTRTRAKDEVTRQMKLEEEELQRPENVLCRFLVQQADEFLVALDAEAERFAITGEEMIPENEIDPILPRDKSSSSSVEESSSEDDFSDDLPRPAAKKSTNSFSLIGEAQSLVNAKFYDGTPLRERAATSRGNSVTATAVHVRKSPNIIVDHSSSSSSSSPVPQNLRVKRVKVASAIIQVRTHEQIQSDKKAKELRCRLNRLREGMTRGDDPKTRCWQIANVATDTIFQRCISDSDLVDAILRVPSYIPQGRDCRFTIQSNLGKLNHAGLPKGDDVAIWYHDDSVQQKKNKKKGASKCTIM